MRRREFIAAIGSTAVWPLAVRAQQSGRIPVVGVFWAYADAEAAAASRRRSTRSRFAAAIGLRAKLEGYVPTV